MERLQEKYKRSPIVADIYSLDQLKITLDDLLVECVSALGFKERNMYMDIQNSIGIVSTIMAVAVTWMSECYRFQDIKLYMVWLVLGYFGINGLSCLYSHLNGGKIRFDGLEIVTRIDKTPIYVVLIYKRSKPVPAKYRKSVLDLFDESGKLDHVLFISDIKTLFNDE